jgi:hypothetical protein
MVEMITEEQRRTLNAACGDLSAQVVWHGFRLSKDDWRHLLAGMARNRRLVPAPDMGDGEQQFILLGGSSKELSKAQASDALTLGFSIGDSPTDYGLVQLPVRWCKAVVLARWIEKEEPTP